MIDTPPFFEINEKSNDMQDPLKLIKLEVCF